VGKSDLQRSITNDALAAEFASRGVRFSVPIGDNDDDLTGFVIEDIDGYGLFFGHVQA
jgi:hypothetical protein